MRSLLLIFTYLSLCNTYKLSIIIRPKHSIKMKNSSSKLHLSDTSSSNELNDDINNSTIDEEMNSDMVSSKINEEEDTLMNYINKYSSNRRKTLVRVISVILSSVIAFILGDCSQQLISGLSIGTDITQFDFRRLFNFGVLGGVTYGMISTSLRSYVSLKMFPDKGKTSTIKRVISHELISAPISIFLTLSVLSKLGTERFWVCLKGHWIIWSLAHVINFYFLPQSLRLHFFNALILLWAKFFSAQTFTMF